VLDQAAAAGPALRNAEMELRKCCNHPYLVDGVEDQARAVKSARKAACKMRRKNAARSAA
jgi:hypothetical protein